MGRRTIVETVGWLVAVLVVLLGTAGSAVGLIVSTDFGDEDDGERTAPTRTAPAEPVATGERVSRHGVRFAVPEGWRDVTRRTLARERRQGFSVDGPGVDPNTIVVLARGGTDDRPDWTIRLGQGSRPLGEALQKVQDGWVRERYCTRPDGPPKRGEPRRDVRSLPLSELGGERARVCESRTTFPRRGRIEGFRSFERKLSTTHGGFEYELTASGFPSRRVDEAEWARTVAAFEAVRASVRFAAGAPRQRGRPFRNDEIAVTIPAGWEDRTSLTTSARQGKVLLAIATPEAADERGIVIGRSAKRTTSPSQQPRILQALRRFSGRLCREPAFWGELEPRSGSVRSLPVTRLGGRSTIHCQARVRAPTGLFRVDKLSTVRDGYDISIVALGKDPADIVTARKALERVRRSFRFR